MIKKFTAFLMAALMLFGVVSSTGITTQAADGATNYPLNSIVIKLEDAVTHAMLVGGRFEVYYTNQAVSGGLGTLVATIDTDASGVIVISGIPSGYYTVRQTVPPNNYHLSITNEQHCYIKPDGTSIEELVFSDYRYGGLVVILTDKDTGKPIGNATFSVSDVNNKAVGNAADGVYMTDAKGEFYLENLPAGDYKITQLTTAQGYALDAVPNSRTVRLQHTNADQSVFRATFENSPLGSLLVRLKDSVSKEPLAGAVFNVRLSGGADLGEFTTGAGGTFLLPKIARGSYIITQVSAPVGYLLANTAQTKYVDYVNTFAVDFENSPKSGLFVVKLDADTKETLKDAKFRVYKGDTLLGTYTTGIDGAFTVPNLEPGWYSVVEYQAPQGYVLDDTPQSVQVTSEKLHKLTFEDKKLASLQIIKTDEYNGQPLSGAKFRVTTQAGVFVADVTTDANGKATVPGVNPGWYVVSETKSPTGYIISETAKTVEVKATIPTVVTITNRAENNLEILKLDAYTRAPLSGATFKVEHSNGAKVGTYITDSAGKVLIGSLTEDTYVISEIAAPDGYQLDSVPQIVVVEGGKLQSVEFLDKPLSGIEIIKTDFYSHAPLMGATFVVERDNGERIGSYRTDAAGKIIVADLTAGTYIVSETIAPEGYMLDAAPQTVVVKNNALTVAEFADKPLSGIQILKTGADGKTPLAGAVFTIDKPNGERVTTGVTNGSGKYTTDVSGKIVVHGLESGVYIVSEVSAPDGYILDSVPQTVEVKSGKLTLVEFTNRELPNLYIRKVDRETGALVAGAEFLIEKNGVFVAYVVSSASGAVVVPHVQPGFYTITEVKAPAGYQLNDPVQTVEVRATGEAYYNSAALAGNIVTFGNNPLNSLEIVKLDSVTHNPLSNATFSVTKANGESLGTFRTDASGKILIPNIIEGTYVVSETAAPQGYILSDAPKSVNVSGGRLVSVEFLNKPLSGIEIVKLDAVNHKPLQGAAFDVTKADGARVGTFRTGADGKALVSGLDEGVYVIGEITAPDGYQLDETPKNVTVISGKLATVEFVNKPFSGIQIVKTDAVSHKPLSGATFEVKRVSGETVGTFKTDVSGKVVVNDLIEGGYIVSEIIAPDGYVLDNTPQTVTVKTGKLTAAEFVNKPFSGIEIRKVDALTGGPLAGAQFEIRKQSGGIVTVDPATTDVGGKASIANVEPGWYVITEVKAPAGYVIDGVDKTIEVKSGSPTVVTFSNSPLSGIEIIKTDEYSHAPLTNATFTLERDNGEKLGTFKTDAAGKIVVPNLTSGTYIVAETIAPDGYIRDEVPKTVIVKSGKLTTVEFTNKPLSGIEIVKTDKQSHAPLAGAVFTVTKTNGERISVGVTNGSGKYTTDISGKILIPGLEPGVYIVSEVQPPENYLLDAQPQTVEVKSNKMTVAPFTDNELPSLYIRKIDSATGALVAGAHFTVTNQRGEVIAEVVSLSTGAVVIPHVQPGIYNITETKAPAGYALNDPMQSIEVRADGGVYYNSAVLSGNVATFANNPLNTLEIVKLDSVMHNPLANAIFSVTKANGEAIGTFRTDASGKILITEITEGTYVVSEIAAPAGYILSSVPQNVNIGGGKLVSVEFLNKPLSGIQIVKLDSVTHNPLSGAKFSVTKSNGEVVGNYTTEADGKVLISGLDEGAYIVGEITAPDGYQRDEAPKNVTVTSGKLATVEFVNKPFSGIQIVKTDSVSHKPLSGATFEVKRSSGETVGTFKTDVSGKAVVNNLTEGGYIVSELIAPDGYVLDNTPQTVTIKTGKLTAAEFVNKPFSGIEIRKVDGISGDALAGAVFEIRKQDGAFVAEVTTDKDGKASVPSVEPGWYTLSETKAPQGYVIDGAAKTVEVKSGAPTIVTVSNKPLSGIEILKLDSVTKAPLMGAAFEVTRDTGEKIGKYVTDKAGKIIVPDLADGTYIISETDAPQGYTLDAQPQTVIVKSGKLTQVEFVNKPLSGIVMFKTDAYSHAPLAGATFVIERDTGEKVGTFKTDVAGKIIAPGLTDGTYIISETDAPQGYILDAQPQTVIVKSGKLTEVEFVNKPLAGLKIVKLNSVTRAPIEGVEFTIDRMNGEHIDNNFRQFTFKTDRAGQIYVPSLEDGYYLITETRAAEGYVLDAEPKTVLVQNGKTTLLEVLNTPMSGLLIVKTDANDGKPLAGVVFDVRRADGQFVAGALLDGNQPSTAANSPNKTTAANGDIMGSYTTDANGRILINGLGLGEYHVIERKALEGYELDTDVHAVTVTTGKLATLQLTNTPKAGLRVIKIDSVTKAPIYGVEFMLFDQNNNVVGRFITDNNGVIDFTGILEEGRYTIRETKAAPGYYLDEIPKTIEFISGKVTEIRWENTAQAGQIQITKRSGDDNEVNGLPKGSTLSGAVFEVYAYKSGNLVDRFISGADGKAVSKPLPLGRYLVKEVQSPKWYKLSDQTLDVELEFPTQILKLEYLNFSANTGVTIRKSGVYETMPGSDIRWDIKELRNDSSVPLTDFYWRDVLPTDAVRLTKIVTGSYNQSLKYKVLVTTNKGDTKVIADNLSTTKNNVIDCAGVNLSLRSDEYVTSFSLVFGVVKPGFTIVEQPQVYAKVLPNLPNGYEFANKCDVGGKYNGGGGNGNGNGGGNGEWIVGNATWRTSVYNPAKLPRTGY